VYNRPDAISDGHSKVSAAIQQLRTAGYCVQFTTVLNYVLILIRFSYNWQQIFPIDLADGATATLFNFQLINVTAQSHCTLQPTGSMIVVTFLN
jgi:hypothetical protein